MVKFLTALAAFAAVATPAFARPADDQLRVRIAISSRDTATEQGRALLADRVDRAIRMACRRESAGIAGLNAVRGDMACRKAMRTDADAKLLALNVGKPATLLASAR